MISKIKMLMPLILLIFYANSVFGQDEKIDVDTLFSETAENEMINFNISKEASSVNQGIDKNVESVSNAQKNMIKKVLPKGGQGNSVIVNTEMTCGVLSFCLIKDLKVFGGPGTVNDNGNWVGIYDNGMGIKGQYKYVASFEKNRVCSGSFIISGSKRNFDIKVFDDCRDAGSIEY